MLKIVFLKLDGNNHLEYFWRKCDICHSKFDWIGKMETFENDTPYITAKVNSLPFAIFPMFIYKAKTNDVEFHSFAIKMKMKKCKNY